MPFAWKSRDGSGVFGEVVPPEGLEADQPAAMQESRLNGERVRLAILLALLGLTLIALFTSNNFFTQSGQAGAAAPSPSWCVTKNTLGLASVRPAELSDLRERLNFAIAPAGGSGYASGMVGPTEVWTDLLPGSTPLTSSTIDVPGGYEIRRWAPDPQWGARYADDVVADGFQFDTSAQARRFFDQATFASCYRSGSVHNAVRPPGARRVGWVNPVDATEEDVLLVRGRVVYRISDVRPQDPPPPTSDADHIGFLTAEALACNLPDASCARHVLPRQLGRPPER